MTAPKLSEDDRLQQQNKLVIKPQPLHRWSPITHAQLVAALLVATLVMCVNQSSASPPPPPPFTDPYIVKVNKCCEKFEVIEGGRCTDARKINNGTGTATFEPIFTSAESGQSNVNIVDYKFVLGMPDCKSMQMWPIYQYPSVSRRLFF